MKDLTKGPIHRHILEMAAPMAIGMLVQTLYYLVDLWFVSRLGDAAIAGVSAAGNVMFVVLGLTQMLGVGTVALIAQAVGRRDPLDANRVFNQSIVLSLLAALLTLFAGYGLSGWYMGRLGADAAAAAAGRTYLAFFLPGLALQFALNAMGSALRGTGIVKPTMTVQALTILLNIALAPVLIAGWGTGRPLGVAGAGLATSIAVGIGVVLMAIYFGRLEKYVRFDRALARPHLPTWRRMFGIGLPAGGEFVLMFVFMASIFWIIRHFGAAAQAGFGVGSRVMQALFLPAMAVAFSAAPIAGQNFGAREPERVVETLKKAALLGSAIMFALTLLCQWRPELFVLAFTREPEVVAVGGQFLRFISWNFVASGLVFTFSGMFQALGNTWPSLLSTATRLATFVGPAIWLSRQPGFRIEQVWYLSVATVALQAATSFLFLRAELKRKLAGLTRPTEPSAPAELETGAIG